MRGQNHGNVWSTAVSNLSRTHTINISQASVPDIHLLIGSNQQLEPFLKSYKSYSNCLFVVVVVVVEFIYKIRV
jgi:hypothetical protein